MSDFTWQHIEFEDGSNPYICITEENFNYMKNKYNLVNVDGRFWLAKNKEDNKNDYCFGYFEAVEVCPHCMSENTYPMWDVEKLGFVAVCKHCGEEIFLCDECIHVDMENGIEHDCDWCETKCGGKCRRGETRERN